MIRGHLWAKRYARIRNENIVSYDTLGDTISPLLANCHISAYLVACRMVIVNTISHCGHVYGRIFSFSKEHSFFACKASGLQRKRITIKIQLT